MYRKLLVPLDGSVLAEHALPIALEIARRADAAIHLIHIHVPVASADPSLDTHVRANEEAYLRGVMQRFRGPASVCLTEEVLDGFVSATLAERAAAAGADLVVMTTHGRGPLTRFWLGSVADKLLRITSMPVLLLRPQDGAPGPVSKPFLRHILVPLDGSELAEQALEPAIALGALTQADYTLLRVVEPILLPDRHLAGNALRCNDSALVDQLYRGAQGYVERLADRLRARSLHVETRVSINRPAVHGILEEARTQAPQLIALATHGRSGLARLFLGSVADKVVRGSLVPVLVCRPSEK
jgi:nucleotide-binding universal stress UspA family protein